VLETGDSVSPPETRRPFTRQARRAVGRRTSGTVGWVHRVMRRRVVRYPCHLGRVVRSLSGLHLVSELPGQAPRVRRVTRERGGPNVRNGQRDGLFQRGRPGQGTDSGRVVGRGWISGGKTGSGRSRDRFGRCSGDGLVTPVAGHGQQFLRMGSKKTPTPRFRLGNTDRWPVRPICPALPNHDGPAESVTDAFRLTRDSDRDHPSEVEGGQPVDESRDVTDRRRPR